MIKPENILQIDGNLTNGNGGSSQSNTSVGQSTSQVTFSTYFFTITSNESKFDTIVNDEIKYNTKSIRILKDDLVDKNVKIAIIKEGYVSNEYYEIELDSSNASIIKNTLLNKVFGISSLNVLLKYYVGDVLQSTTTLSDTNNKTLNFKLNKSTTPTTEVEQLQLSLSVFGNGSPVSVLKNGLKSAEFFPTIGSNTYSDYKGTTFKISSSDVTKFRVKEIQISNGSSNKKLTALDGESLQTTITLNESYQITIDTEEIKSVEVVATPEIKLINMDARTYNINSKLGVPIAFEKNSAVKAVTIIIGDDILEFDELEAGSIAGVTIPHSSFKKIGKYGVKMFPFSLSDYEPKPIVKQTPIKQKEVAPKFEVSEELVVAPTPKVQVNPYTQPKSAQGGGGSSVITNPFSGDMVLTQSPTRNIK
jgi:hypothetical protein